MATNMQTAFSRLFRRDRKYGRTTRTNERRLGFKPLENRSLLSISVDGTVVLNADGSVPI
jgi:hypothetical protein